MRFFGALFADIGFEQRLVLIGNNTDLIQNPYSLAFLTTDGIYFRLPHNGAKSGNLTLISKDNDLANSNSRNNFPLHLLISEVIEKMILSHK